MKQIKFRLTTGALLAAALLAGSGLTSCKGEAEKAAPVKEKKAQSKAAHELPNYRYVDLDTLLSKYNLSKDYNEEMMRMQTNAESAAKRHEGSIQNFAAQMQKKMQNNVYQSQESYKQDEAKLQQMQASAQKEMAGLQKNMEESAIKAQKAVNDSIDAFIRQYNKQHGYDAIFVKGATLYIDEDLDITMEVVEGLNARYNKIKK